MKQRHSQKPDELYDMIEHCSPDPFLELFARNTRRGRVQWETRFRREAQNFPRKSLTAANGKQDDGDGPTFPRAA
jgi:hypothetical protein